MFLIIILYWKFTIGEKWFVIISIEVIIKNPNKSMLNAFFLKQIFNFRSEVKWKVVYQNYKISEIGYVLCFDFRRLFIAAVITFILLQKPSPTNTAYYTIENHLVPATTSSPSVNASRSIEGAHSYTECVLRVREGDEKWKNPLTPTKMNVFVWKMTNKRWTHSLTEMTKELTDYCSQRSGYYITC